MLKSTSVQDRYRRPLIVGSSIVVAGLCIFVGLDLHFHPRWRVGPETMIAIATVAVGLLITVAVEDKPVHERPGRRALLMASRTVPPGAALLLALLGVALDGHLTNTAANSIGWVAFSLSAAGALSVMFTAVNDAYKPRMPVGGELATELNRLGQLYESGTLTAEEFAAAKGALLGTPRGT